MSRAEERITAIVARCGNEPGERCARLGTVGGGCVFAAGHEADAAYDGCEEFDHAVLYAVTGLQQAAEHAERGCAALLERERTTRLQHAAEVRTLTATVDAQRATIAKLVATVREIAPLEGDQATLAMLEQAMNGALPRKEAERPLPAGFVRAEGGMIQLDPAAPSSRTLADLAGDPQMQALITDSVRAMHGVDLPPLAGVQHVPSVKVTSGDTAAPVLIEDADGTIHVPSIAGTPRVTREEWDAVKDRHGAPRSMTLVGWVPSLHTRPDPQPTPLFDNSADALAHARAEDERRQAERAEDVARQVDVAKAHEVMTLAGVGASGTLAERVAALVARVANVEAKHPHAPDKCPVCDWSNTGLMNYGTPGASRWMCHGCAARLLQDGAAEDIARRSRDHVAALAREHTTTLARAWKTYDHDVGALGSIAERAVYLADHHGAPPVLMTALRAELDAHTKQISLTQMEHKS